MEQTQTYFDNAATSFPKPESVYETANQEFRNYSSPKRGGSAASRTGKQRMQDVRVNIAKLFNIEDPSRIVFTPGCTYSLNLAIQAFKWKAGDGILISAIDHNVLSRPARKLAKERGVNLYISPYKDEQPFDLQYCEELLKEKKIKMIAVIHASNVIGCILPIDKIGELAHKYNVTLLVDAAQSAGYCDIDVQKQHISMLAIPGHKGLYGPSGIGALYVSNKVELTTFIEGGTGNDSGKHEMNPNTFPDSFEVGTIPIHLILALGEGVKYLLETTCAKIKEKELQVFSELLKELQQIKKVRIYGHKIIEQKVPVVSFFIENTNPTEVATLLADKYHIITRGGFHCAPMAHETLKTLEQKGTIRISIGYHNTLKDVETVISAVKEIAGHK